MIVHATQENVASDFWMRAIAQTNCSKVTNYDNIKGVFHYGDSTDVAETPSTSPFNYTDSCVDELMSNLVPILEVDASPATFEDDEIANVSVNANGIYQWFMGPTTFKSEWNDPTLLQISQSNTSWSESEHVIQVDGVNEWVFVAIEAATGAPHPVHLHVSMPPKPTLSSVLIRCYRAMTLSSSPKVPGRTQTKLLSSLKTHRAATRLFCLVMVTWLLDFRQIILGPG